MSYSIGARKILDNVEFTVEDGEKVALVGPNGSGKSTMIKIIMQTLIPESGKIIKSKNITNIAYMPQHISQIKDLPETSVTNFMLSVRNIDALQEELNSLLKQLNKSGLNLEVAEKLAKKYSDIHEEFISKGGYSSEDDLLNILVGIGLENIDLNKNVSELSGGQKTKLAFARVLFSRPDLMILDEPTNHLDCESISWATNFLKSYKGSLVIVSHDTSILDKITTKTIYFDGSGKSLVFKGNYSLFLKKKKALDENSEKQMNKLNAEKEKLETLIKKWKGKKPKLVEDRRKKLERLSKEAPNATEKRKNIKLEIRSNRRSSLKLIELSSVFKKFGNTIVLDGVSFLVNRGDRIAISGENGAGKTTLLKILSKELMPNCGIVSYGNNVDIGYYAQEHEILNPNNQVWEEISSNSSLSTSKIRSLLAHFLFTDDHVFTKIGQLSLGEKSRLALAKILIKGANTLILDEPTNHLDIPSKGAIADALSIFDGTLIIVSHDEDFLSKIGIKKVFKLPQKEFKIYKY